MRIAVNFSAFSRTRWYEYLSRFAFGGAVTALAGIIAKDFGPAIGGLFLAFPAIFPATAWLIEDHEKRKKHKAGAHGTVRGRKAAAVDAAGAAIGSFGLMAFALLAWKLLPELPSGAALLIATAGWLMVSVLFWNAWKAL